MKRLITLAMAVSIGMFIFPPIMAHYIFRKNKENYLKLIKPKTYQLLLLSGVLMLVAIPFINFLAQINQAMILPESLSSFAEWMKQKEADAAKLTEVFLKANHIYTLLINIFVVGLLPAVGEEMLFRGVLQKTFTQMTKNVHWAIWITGFIFAAVHMQFYTFLPRFMMGVLFGYLFVWSGSLWVTITAHFINNSTAVIIHYLAQKNVINSDLDSVGGADSNYLLLFFSLLLFSAIVYSFWKNRLSPQ
jgi:membrane protease YdiL (CAAX protease family)